MGVGRKSGRSAGGRLVGRALVLGAAFAVDAVIGDPVRPTHPARVLGRTIQLYEWTARRLPGLSGDPGKERAAGVALAVGLPVGAFALTRRLLRSLPGWARPAVDVWLVSTALAGTELVRSAERVSQGLDASLEDGRRAVSMIVGRDTRAMTESDVVRSAVESVAENTSDGVIAPLLYAAVGGAPVALAYKAVSTLDSMVGYRTERHLHFGRSSARLDDAANLIPARVTAVLAILAGGRGTGALRRAWAERVHHPSPNAGLVEAAFANALGVRLGGPVAYGGRVVERPFLGGAASPPPAAADLARVAALSRRVSVLAVGACVGGLLVAGSAR